MSYNILKATKKGTYASDPLENILSWSKYSLIHAFLVISGCRKFKLTEKNPTTLKKQGFHIDKTVWGMRFQMFIDEQTVNALQTVYSCTFSPELKHIMEEILKTIEKQYGPNNENSWDITNIHDVLGKEMKEANIKMQEGLW
jgi:predicted HNH restriction endonuclease